MPRRHYLASTAILLAASLSNAALADVTTVSGQATCVLENPANVDAAVKTTVFFYRPGANPDGNDPVQPMTCDCDWTFTWDSDKPGQVGFEGAVRLGDYFVVIDAGTLGGMTRQTFYNVTHKLKGEATWNAATAGMSYLLEPVEPDDGQASVVDWDKPPVCEKIKGLTAGRACAASEASSLELEGLKVDLTFSEDLSRFEGSAVLTQYGGSGMTKSETPMMLKLSGSTR